VVCVRAGRDSRPAQRISAARAHRSAGMRAIALSRFPSKLGRGSRKTPHKLPSRPMGSMVAYVGPRQRRAYFGCGCAPLESIHARLVPGSEGADQPFWSRIVVNIGFRNTNSSLVKIAVNGTLRETVASVKGFRGGSWNRDNYHFCTRRFLKVPSTRVRERRRRRGRHHAHSERNGAPLPCFLLTGSISSIRRSAARWSLPHLHGVARWEGEEACARFRMERSRVCMGLSPLRS
jgi:hypothetical protein